MNDLLANLSPEDRGAFRDPRQDGPATGAPEPQVMEVERSAQRTAPIPSRLNANRQASSGKPRFRLNVNIDDLGHTLVVAPTGSGMSMLTSVLALQWSRYERACIRPTRAATGRAKAGVEIIVSAPRASADVAVGTRSADGPNTKAQERDGQ